MKILLIEDDLDDIELFTDALEAHGAPYALNTLNDGNAALDYIGAATGRPDIIILDFNLPKIHGREVALAIKSSALWSKMTTLRPSKADGRPDRRMPRATIPV